VSDTDDPGVLRVSETAEVVRGLQARAARALPADETKEVEGWWLRHAPDGPWWVGSVLPYADAKPGELDRRVATAEHFYARRDATARFQISPGACPDGLDTALAERGYRRLGVMSLQVAPAAPAREPTSRATPQVHLDDRPTRPWFEVWHAMHGDGGDPRSGWNMLGRVEPPSAYVWATKGNRVLGVGRAVADRGWAGVFGMATVPEARGRGVARDVLAALAGWAHARDAECMYLQVAEDNIPARRLYERLGFVELTRYHYRAAG
jgi:ribosomal protein S18 acetylase RimI-like enzyme